MVADIDADLLAKLPPTDIARVTFYKRDELTTDLICDVVVGDEVWTFHEELVGWGLLIDHLQRLPSLRGDRFEAVSAEVILLYGIPRIRSARLPPPFLAIPPLGPTRRLRCRRSEPRDCPTPA